MRRRGRRKRTRSERVIAESLSASRFKRSVMPGCELVLPFKRRPERAAHAADPCP